jgi:hypothetical protein
MPNIKPNSISKLEKFMRKNDCEIGTLASIIINNIDLDKNIIKLFEKTSTSIINITVPFDKMLTEPKDGKGRMAAEETVSNLLIIAEKIKLAGNDLNWEVLIAE